MDNEERRLAELDSYQILDTEPEAAFNDLSRLAALLSGCPIALVSFVDEKRQWFKAKVGLDVSQTPRDISFCQHAIKQDHCFIVEDAQQDPRFAINPLVTDFPAIRFYAGAPLRTDTGEKLGTLCVIDQVPRVLTDEQQEGLMALGRQVVAQLDLRRRLREAAILEVTMRETKNQLRQQERLLHALATALSQWIAETNPHQLFAQLLKEVLDLTECGYGFIGEVFYNPDGNPVLKTYAITDIAWNEETRRYYDQFQAEGLEFTNMATLFGEVILTRCPLLTNDPANHPKSGGLPPGHPAMHSFMGLPIMRNKEMLGMVGLANYPGGFTTESAEFLEPFIATCGRIMMARRNEIQRLQAQELLLTANSRLKALIENLQPGVLLEDEHRHILIVNRSFCRLFGIPVEPDRLIGADCSQSAEYSKHLFADSEAFVTNVEQRLVERRVVSSETLLMRDGRVLERDYVPIFVGETYRGHLWLYRDVSERAQAMSALQNSEDRTRQMLDTALDAVIAMDADGTITAWNRRAEQIFGWTREEAIGRLLANLIIPEEQRASHFAALKRYIMTRESSMLNQRIEVEGLYRSGERFPIELAISPIEIGSEISFNAFLRDIRDRKTAEQQIAAQAEELTVALGRAEMASRLKSEFVASMSHEIRTPLNAVIGMTGLLLDTPLSPIQRELAETSRRSADSLLTLINDVLDFSKIEAGKLTIEPEPFDLLQVLEDVATLVGPDCLLKSMEFLVRYAPNTPRYVIGDAGRIRQILLNLTSNAVKFTQSGYILMVMECVAQAGEETDNQAIIRMSVTDTGIGIPPEKLEIIFEMFTQADATTTRVYGGTGLGLAISRQLADLMGGTLQVESNLGKGSNFALELPLRLNRSIVVEPSPLLENSSALIIHPDDLARSILQELLGSWGVHWQSVESLEAAIRYMEERPEKIEYVLLDSLAVNQGPANVTYRSNILEKLSTLAKSHRSTLILMAPFDFYNSRDFERDTERTMENKGIVPIRVGKPLRPTELRDALLNIARSKAEKSFSKRTL